ncbi:hypothetical protein HYH03_003878 [Edaphochlamys debaryana]|uniref:MYM-type domain-containing protein n=1 Tax=Edaphochlamys debaryana TaxID=47281 RepID=A0A835Y8A1_9CHLO|nr:hypothetical protein HYH03_003878 [Edaphochlamys debaryana]|eukprot:KAG2498120.1 hypothetical protein HYH03_003878 [Edaphochlamys debaryana]
MHDALEDAAPLAYNGCCSNSYGLYEYTDLNAPAEAFHVQNLAELGVLPELVTGSGAGSGAGAAGGPQGVGPGMLSGGKTVGVKGATKAAAAQPAEQAADDSQLKAIRLLMDFDEKCKNGEWPASTSVHCYWCCHRFTNVPVGIPLSYNEDLGKFMVYGCFCSCECAAAYNLDSKESSDKIMMRHGFLNMLARELGHPFLVRPAPSHIEEFQERCHTSRLILVNFPPMMTVTQQVEEVNQRELRSEYRYIPIDNERVNKYKEKIKLKRTKPLVNYRNTLDHAMNLRFT